MENIKKQSIRAYILIESLLALLLLSLLTTIVLTEINKNRQYIKEQNRQIEVFNVAKMALESNLDALSINGVSIKIVKKNKKILIMDEEKEILILENQSN